MHCWYVVLFNVFVLNLFIIVVVQLWNVVLSDETLRNVISSVTRNWQSIVLTAILALIIIYHYAIIGYLAFQQHFVFEQDNNNGDDDKIGYVLFVIFYYLFCKNNSISNMLTTYSVVYMRIDSNNLIYV
jgi:hypothetical protein